MLSSGHAGLALYCVIEKYAEYVTPEGIGNYLDAEKIFEHHGVHPDRCDTCQLDCSTGSLGHGLGIAVGMALADRSKICYTLISDGECSEGSIHEALRIAEEQQLDNLKIYVNYNEWGAYKKIPNYPLERLDNIYVQPNVRYTTMEEWPEFLQEQESHYKVLNENEYKICLEILGEDLSKVSDQLNTR